jgi:hypothetical protein
MFMASTQPAIDDDGDDDDDQFFDAEDDGQVVPPPEQGVPVAAAGYISPGFVLSCGTGEVQFSNGADQLCLAFG